MCLLEPFTTISEPVTVDAEPVTRLDDVTVVTSKDDFGGLPPPPLRPPSFVSDRSISQGVWRSKFHEWTASQLAQLFEIESDNDPLYNAFATVVRDENISG